MKFSSSKALIILLAVLVVATIAFIFAHSLQASAGSWADSNAAAVLFEPVLRGLYDSVGGFLTKLSGYPKLTYEAFVRKCAHFTEYAVLGVGCTAVVVCLSRKVISPYLWADLFALLAIAVFDEYIQAFFGRTSRAADVVIDFSGALVGVVGTLIVAAIVLKRRAGNK